MLACPASFFEERFPTSGNDNTVSYNGDTTLAFVIINNEAEDLLEGR